MIGQDRIPCCVIGCGRTRKPWEDGSAFRWVCGAHWRHVSKTKKRRMSLAGRKWRKLWAKGEQNGRRGRRWSEIWWRTFNSACSEAIEAAMGIS